MVICKKLKQQNKHLVRQVWNKVVAVLGELGEGGEGKQVQWGWGQRGGYDEFVFGRKWSIFESDKKM